MGPRTVLVVDDDSSIRLLCRVNLELDGHRVLEAATLPEARDALAAGPIDVVLLDVHVGGRDGLELLEDIRRDHPEAGVALLTGEADPPVHADAVIGKPFTLDELRTTVERIGSGR